MNHLQRPSRLISVDIMKGIGILGMLFSHAFFKGVWYTEGNAAVIVGEHAPMVIPFALPLIIVGTWPGFFVLMTGLLNAYLTARRLEKGRTMAQAVRPMYVSALLFLLIHIFMVCVLHDFRPDLHHPGETTAGLFGNLMTGNGMKISHGQWYVHTILSLLAFANVFFALLMSFLFRNNKWKNRRRTSLNLLVCATAILAISALVSEPSYRLVLKLVDYRTLPADLAIFILQSISASQLDLFPLAAYGCIGMIVALFLLEDRERKNYAPLGRFLRITGAVSLVLGIGLIALRVLTADVGPVDAIFIYEPYPVHLAVFNLGLILFVLDLAMRLFEYLPLAKLKALSDRTRFLRATGMLTLTLYVLEFPIRSFFSFNAHRIFGGTDSFPDSFLTFAFDRFMVSPGAITLFMVAIMAFWILLILLFIRLNFKGSFEWIFTKTANLMRPDDKSRKADMDHILYPFVKE